MAFGVDGRRTSPAPRHTRVPGVRRQQQLAGARKSASTRTGNSGTAPPAHDRESRQLQSAVGKSSTVGSRGPVRPKAGPAGATRRRENRAVGAGYPGLAGWLANSSHGAMEAVRRIRRVRFCMHLYMATDSVMKRNFAFPGSYLELQRASLCSAY